MRRQMVASVVLALALGPGGTLAAEEEPTATPDCMATTETDLPDEECVEAKPVAVQLPVADYWEEWADHKVTSLGRAKRAIQNARRSVSKIPRSYQRLVGAHSDELQWLAHHEPQACYSDEYEGWRTAIEDVRSIHKNMVRFLRARNASGVQRTGKQQKAAMKRLNKALPNVADCDELVPAPSDATPSSNPFVGSWKTFDRDVEKDGFQNRSKWRLKVVGDGRFLLRVDRTGECRTRGLGYVPATLRGTGEFDLAIPELRWGGAKLHCYPRRGGRTLIASGAFGAFRHDAAADVLYDYHGHHCWWRKGTGRPANCTAFWQGTATLVEEEEDAETPGLSSSEE